MYAHAACVQASGVMASMTLLGSFIGFALFGFYLDVEHSHPNPNPDPDPDPDPSQAAAPRRRPGHRP